MFGESKILKQYLAITKNIPKPNEGEINIPLIEREINGIVKVNQTGNLLQREFQLSFSYYYIFYFFRLIYRRITTNIQNSCWISQKMTKRDVTMQ
jgi:hypothetical protein